MVRAVENTNATKKTSIPWWRSSHASGAWIVRPTRAATDTMTSSRYALITWRPRRAISILSPSQAGEVIGSGPPPAPITIEEVWLLAPCWRATRSAVDRAVLPIVKWHRDQGDSI